jgi:hypothetical protein
MCPTDAFGRKRIFGVDIDLQGPTGHQIPQLRAVTVAFLECHYVICYPESCMRLYETVRNVGNARDPRGTKELDVLLGKFEQVHGFNRARRIAK